MPILWSHDLSLPKSVAASSALLKIGGEECLGKRALDSVEEGRLSCWLHGVDAAESQTEKAVVVGVRGKFARDRSGSLNGLRGSRNRTHDNLVRVDGALGTRAVTVGDVPGVARLERARFAWVVQCVAA